MRSLKVTALCGAFLMAAALPAMAAQHGRTALRITVTASGQEPQTYVLRCDPDGGDHPNPEVACDRLRAVDGRLSGLRRSNSACPWISEPYEVAVVGRWQGRNIALHSTFANLCRAKAAGDGVFVF
ncbi:MULTISPECIES: SSI family serine proteinase inhibitor [unclassified Nonomuraea]|uniref:SSI family serine proteinase inhibitor n=1 Tax=unclassified Nonomuraea TaxID=2593643 RepID=UPI0033EA2703